MSDEVTPKKRGRQIASGLETDGASAEARQLAAAILEVLAGARTPTEAAQSLNMSLPRYYTLEVRALQGLLDACEPRRRGGGRKGDSLTALRLECERLRRESARQQALLRAAHRTVGLSAPAPADRPATAGKIRRKRRPTARALKAAARLKQEAACVQSEPAVSEVIDPR